jgi:hypothetical protein
MASPESENLNSYTGFKNVWTRILQIFVDQDHIAICG